MPGMPGHRGSYLVIHEPANTNNNYCSNISVCAFFDAFKRDILGINWDTLPNASVPSSPPHRNNQDFNCDGDYLVNVAGEHSTVYLKHLPGLVDAASVSLFDSDTKDAGNFEGFYPGNYNATFRIISTASSELDELILADRKIFVSNGVYLAFDDTYDGCYDTTGQYLDQQTYYRLPVNSEQLVTIGRCGLVGKISVDGVPKVIISYSTDVGPIVPDMAFNNNVKINDYILELFSGERTPYPNDYFHDCSPCTEEEFCDLLPDSLVFEIELPNTGQYCCDTGGPTPDGINDCSYPIEPMCSPGPCPSFTLGSNDTLNCSDINGEYILSASESCDFADIEAIPNWETYRPCDDYTVCKCYELTADICLTCELVNNPSDFFGNPWDAVAQPPKSVTLQVFVLKCNTGDNPTYYFVFAARRNVSSEDQGYGHCPAGADGVTTGDNIEWWNGTDFDYILLDPCSLEYICDYGFNVNFGVTCCACPIYGKLKWPASL